MQDLSPHLRVKLIPVIQEIRNKCLRRGLRGLIDLRRVLGVRDGPTATDVITSTSKTSSTSSARDDDDADRGAGSSTASSSVATTAAAVMESASQPQPHMEAERLQAVLSQELGVNLTNYQRKLICIGFQGDTGYIDLGALCAWVCGLSLPPFASEGETRRKAVVNLFHTIKASTGGAAATAEVGERAAALALDRDSLLAVLDPQVAAYSEWNHKQPQENRGEDEGIDESGGVVLPVPQDQLLNEVLVAPPHPIDNGVRSFHTRYYYDHVTLSEFVSYYAAVSDGCGGDTDTFLSMLHHGWGEALLNYTDGANIGADTDADAETGGSTTTDIGRFVAATDPSTLLCSHRSPGRSGNGRPHVDTLGASAVARRAPQYGANGVGGEPTTTRVAGYCGHIPMVQERFGETFQKTMSQVSHISTMLNRGTSMAGGEGEAQVQRNHTYRPEPILKKMSMANVHNFKLA